MVSQTRGTWQVLLCNSDPHQFQWFSAFQTHRSDTTTKQQSIFFIYTHQNLAFITMKGCLFPKQYTFSQFLSFEISYHKPYPVWKLNRKMLLKISFHKNNLPFFSSSVLLHWTSRHGVRIYLSWKAKVLPKLVSKAVLLTRLQPCWLHSQHQQLQKSALHTRPFPRWTMIPATGGASPAQPPADISVPEFMGVGRYLRPQGHKKKWLVGDISMEATHASCSQAVT